MNNYRKLLLCFMAWVTTLGCYACGGGNGQNGKDGKDGKSCTITNNEDGSATITCPDGSSFTIKNGEDGQNGDAGSDGEKGQNGQSCKLVKNADGSAAVVCPYDGTSYIVHGNTDNYKNYCKLGYFGAFCEKGCTPENDFTNVTECSFTDIRDNNVYRVVTIGKQVWMAENMRNETNATCYKDEGRADWSDIYGCLYTCDEAQNVCPAGWHLPTKAELEQLVATTGAGNDVSGLLDQSWEDGSNTTGFGTLPTGFMSYDNHNYFDYFGISADFWSSTPDEIVGTNDPSQNTYHDLTVGTEFIRFGSYQCAGGLSVRCVRD